MQKSLRFYKNLGFTIMYDRPREGFAYLEREGAELMLDQIGQTRDWVKAPAEYPFGRGMNLQIATSDVNALYQAVKNSGYEIFLEIENKIYTCGPVDKTSRQFIVCDPDGYLLRFYQDVT